MTAPRTHEATSIEFACEVCGAFVQHFEEGRWYTVVPVPHAAPCGKRCMGGGVTREELMLGNIHRGDQCTCQEGDE